MGRFGSQGAFRPRGTNRRSRGRILLHGTVATALLAVGSVAAVSVGSSATSAGAATEGNGPNGAFYDIPTAPTGDSHGTLLYYTSTSSSQLKDATGWDIAYVSEDATGALDVVTGSVWVPTAAWTGTGPRPIVDFAVGTQGLGQQCAPSKQLASGTEYDAVGISGALGKGYAVAVTDYQWSGTTDTPPPTYMVGLAQGRSVLDAAIAAAQVPGAGLSASAPVITWGYSQGGGATTEAAQLWPTYAPQVNLVGDASGGVPGNLLNVASALNGSLGAAFLFDTIVGYHSAYPSLPFTSLINSAGTAALATAEKNCMTVELIDNLFKNIDSYTNGGLTLTQVEAEGNWTQTITENSAGLTGAHIDVPVFMYRGDVDEIIPTSVEDAVYANLCATKTTIQAATYPGDHLLTDYEAVGDALTFIGNVLAGSSIFNSCNVSSTNLYQAVNL